MREEWIGLPLYDYAEQVPVTSDVITWLKGMKHNTRYTGKKFQVETESKKKKMIRRQVKWDFIFSSNNNLEPSFLTSAHSSEIEFVSKL